MALTFEKNIFILLQYENCKVKKLLFYNKTDGIIDKL